MRRSTVVTALLLTLAMSFGASDLHLRAGSFPVIRVNGELRPLSGVERSTSAGVQS